MNMITAIEQKLEELNGRNVTVAMKYKGRILNAPLAEGRMQAGYCWCHVGYRMIRIRNIKSIDTDKKLICI